jgi:hypothetical protein
LFKWAQTNQLHGSRLGRKKPVAIVDHLVTFAAITSYCKHHFIRQCKSLFLNEHPFNAVVKGFAMFAQILKF